MGQIFAKDVAAAYFRELGRWLRGNYKDALVDVNGALTAEDKKTAKSNLFAWITA